MKSIKTKLTLVILLSTVIFSSLIAVVLLSNSYKAYEDEAIDKLRHMTYLYASEFDQDLLAVERFATSVDIMVSGMFDRDRLANDPNYMDNFKVSIRPVIKKIAEQGEITQSAYIFFLPTLDGRAHDVWYSDLDYSGRVVLQEEFELEYYDQYLPGKEWFFGPLTSGEPYWTNPYAGNAYYDDHIIYLSYTRPVYVNGDIIGIAGSDYHFNLLKDYISDIEVYDTGYAFLLNEKGQVLVHSTLDEMTSLDTYSEGQYRWMQEQMVNNQEGDITYKWTDGREKMLVYKQLENGWIFGLTVEKEQVFAWYKDLKIFLAVLIVIVLSFTGFIAYQLGSYITRDLITLKDHVIIIGGGDYDHSLTQNLLDKKDETGVLATSIELMRQKQKESFRKITESNDLLEQKVERRTAALQVKTDALLESLEQNKLQNIELVDLNAELELSIETLKEAQTQLIESEKLASLGFLVTRLSHEFNTPLGSLLTVGSYMIKRKSQIEENMVKGKMTQGDLLTYFDDFDQSSQMVMDNISQLKSLVSRFKELDPESIITHRSQVNMRSFVDVIIDGLHRDLDHLTFDINCSSELVLTIDQGKVGQILSHLLENAIDHGLSDRDKGHIHVGIEVVDAYLNLSVVDDGVGITEDHLKHIFVPFYSENLSKATNGLGLSTVYNIVTKILKGTIECRSALGVGTGVYISFPLNH